MGVDRKDYVMFAVDINDKKIDFYDDGNEKYLPYIEGHSDVEFSIVDDCMSRRYCFFGKIIKSAEDYDGFDREPIDIDDYTINKIKNQIGEEYYQLFDECLDINIIKLYCFTKWS